MSRIEWSTRLKKADWLLLSGIVILFVGSLVWTLGYFSGAKTGAAVRVSAEGRADAIYPLDTDRVVEIEGEHGRNVLCIKDGRAYVSEADCPDQYCVKHVPIRKDRETIICLPHKLVVTVEGGEAWEMDDVAN